MRPAVFSLAPGRFPRTRLCGGLDGVARGSHPPRTPEVGRGAPALGTSTPPDFDRLSGLWAVPHHLPHAPAPSQAADSTASCPLTLGGHIRLHPQSDNGASLVAEATGRRALPHFRGPQTPGLPSLGAAFHSLLRFQTQPRSPPGRHTLLRQLSH